MKALEESEKDLRKRLEATQAEKANLANKLKDLDRKEKELAKSHEKIKELESKLAGSEAAGKGADELRGRAEALQKQLAEFSARERDWKVKEGTLGAKHANLEKEVKALACSKPRTWANLSIYHLTF